MKPEIKSSNFTKFEIVRGQISNVKTLKTVARFEVIILLITTGKMPTRVIPIVYMALNSGKDFRF